MQNDPTTHTRQGILRDRPPRTESTQSYPLNADGAVNLTPHRDFAIPTHASPDPETARLESLAAMHHPDDPQMLAIQHLELHDKEAYDSLSPALRLGYGFWVQGEAAVKGKAS